MTERTLDRPPLLKKVSLALTFSRFGFLHCRCLCVRRRGWLRLGRPRTWAGPDADEQFIPSARDGRLVLVCRHVDAELRATTGHSSADSLAEPDE